MATVSMMFLVAGLLIAISILGTRLSSRFGVPLLLIFLLIGMVAGEEGLLGLSFDSYSQAFIIGQAALALILLDGGLRTHVRTFRSAFKPALTLATIGVFLTSAITGLLAVWLFNLSWVEGLLIGAIVGSTDAAAVFSMLGRGGAALNERVGSTLEIESGTNDPMAIFLTIMLIEVITGEIGTAPETALFFIQQFGLGIALGLAGGYLCARLLSFLDLDKGLYALLTLAFGIIIFSITNLLGGSGFLAIYLCGLVIGNSADRHWSFISPVLDGMAWLSQIGLFLVLGLLVTPSALLEVAVPALILSLGLIFIARPVAVVLSLKPFFKFRWREVGFISWVGLRGAVPIVLAIFPLISGIENPDLYFNIAFMVVLLSLLIQGGTLTLATRIFRVQVPDRVRPIEHGPLGISVNNDYEVFLYRVQNTSLEHQPLKFLRIPSGATLASIFRNGEMLYPRGETRLMTDDLVCIIARRDDLDTLNQLFNTESLARQQQAFFGSFTLNGDSPLPDLAMAYGLVISPSESNLTLGEFIAKRVGGHPVVGDIVEWHGFHWVVSEVTGDQITKIGLHFN